MFAIKAIFKARRRPFGLSPINLHFYSTKSKGDDLTRPTNKADSTLTTEEDGHASTAQIDHVNNSYTYADRPVDDPYNQIKEGMEPVIKYRLHAEQSFFWPPPFADNDSREIGPYPHEADYSTTYQLRDPYAPWDDRNNRRNFGEVMPEEMEALSLWNMDVEQDFTFSYMMGALVAFVGTFCGLWWVGDKYFSGALVPNIGVPRELPYWEKYFPGTKPNPPTG
jgi:hypothetical protein